MKQSLLVMSDICSLFNERATLKMRVGSVVATFQSVEPPCSAVIIIIL